MTWNEAARIHARKIMAKKPNSRLCWTRDTLMLIMEHNEAGFNARERETR